MQGRLLAEFRIVVPVCFQQVASRASDIFIGTHAPDFERVRTDIAGCAIVRGMKSLRDDVLTGERVTFEVVISPEMSLNRKLSVCEAVEEAAENHHPRISIMCIKTNAPSKYPKSTDLFFECFGGFEGVAVGLVKTLISEVIKEWLKRRYPSH